MKKMIEKKGPSNSSKAHIIIFSLIIILPHSSFPLSTPPIHQNQTF
jgi:hypothetical protein